MSVLLEFVYLKNKYIIANGKYVLKYVHEKNMLKETQLCYIIDLGCFINKLWQRIIKFQ